MYVNYLKRFLDFILALLGIFVASPFFITITIILIYINKGVPFYLQKRPGRNEKLFYVIKFKTMNNEKDNKGVLLNDALRLTKFGAFLRKMSLDEIPQLFNVVKGDMSLIGPRPLLVEYLPLYNSEQKRRHSVRPGITGWAQVNGRNLALFSKRFEYDVWYVDNISFMLDFKIFLLTIKKVLSSDGVKSGQDVFDVDDLGFNKNNEKNY
jgi:undecaprenyl phosphate N,N'-diacetylbacillosamine 1-phosphate transferase